MKRLPPLLGILALTGLAALAGCSSGPPEVTMSVEDQSVTVPASMYCENGGPVVAGDEGAVSPIRVGAGERITIEVPDDVAKAGWTVQVWTTADSDDGTLLPSELITTVKVGKHESYDKITTSDAAPDNYYLIVAKEPMQGCPDAGGLWPLGFIREG